MRIINFSNWYYINLFFESLMGYILDEMYEDFLLW